jgi:hypothetical protein
MKKIFLSAVIAMALCSYGYAQDEEEYEEEEAPAQVTKAPAYEEEEEEEEAAPAPKKVEKKKKEAKSSSNGFMGIGIGWDENSVLGTIEYFKLKFRLNGSMQLAALFGLTHYGVTTTTYTPNGGNETSTDGTDDFTPLLMGAEFDFFLPTPLLPSYIGADIIYASAGEKTTPAGTGNDTYSESALQFDVIFGVQAELVSNVYLAGKIGLGFDYLMSDDKTAGGDETSTGRFVFGTQAGIELSWFFL